MAVVVHETVLEAMAAGREAGVTDKTIREAPSRPPGAKLPSWYELYPDTWHDHPGNPRFGEAARAAYRAQPFKGRVKRGPSKAVRALQDQVRELEAQLKAAPAARAASHDCEAVEARVRELESMLNIVRQIAS